LGRFRDWAYRFFSGRNGPDDLYRFISVFSLIFIIAYFIVSICKVYIAAYILLGIILALFCWNLFRALSRNVAKRREENRRFLTVKGRIVRWFRMNVNRFKDRKTKAYRRCPNCKTMLKLPRIKGSHTVKCPQCSTKFKVRV